ncbi:dTDP-4-dehydrorhamnose reductase [Leeia sp. TBRC 13508]|uniref:dTDP-4-dehydrorhamnose reductase n=1 Tax=Leeia speluncae TaxID=2884804 RepID=A0ABS8D976_9NEIS|nr:dTDP-4-dehydrorhamnose reductase [Leeia speluncae]MCB6184761.1 dTDP-4-dehydrorhamnose reductase [Leeia speluncae]
MATKPKLLILGANGQVGFELKRAMALHGVVTVADRARADFTQPDALANYVVSVSPDVIINAAAYTAVDKAESDVETAHLVNASAVGKLADVAKQLDALLIHYSTDYVFAGTGNLPYQESDPIAPANVYGQTKAEGEVAIRQAGCKHLIFRTSWVYGVHGGNFLKTMLRLAKERESLSVVADQIGAPTSAALIADVTAMVVHQYMQADPTSFSYGIYHLVPSGQTNWHAYAKLAIQTALHAGWPVKVDPDNIQPIPTSAYPVPAKRPAWSVMSNQKLAHTFGLTLPDWQSQVTETTRLIVELAK